MTKKLTTHVGVRVDPVDAAWIDWAAARTGTSRSEYVRSVALDVARELRENISEKETKDE